MKIETMIHAYPQSKASKGICYCDVQMPTFLAQGQTELFLKVIEHQMAVYPSDLGVVS